MILESKKPRRFFYHYFKAKKRMSIHFAGACHVVDDVVCKATCETKWRRTQPQLVMQGFARKVEIKNGVATIT